MSGLSKTIDAMAIANTIVVGMAPAMAMGSLYMSNMYNISMANYNLTFATHQSNMQQQAAMVAGIKLIFNN